MMQEVKVIMDAQTKLAFDRLQDALNDVLKPIQGLKSSDGENSSGGIQKITDSVRRLAQDFEDFSEEVLRKLSDVAQSQESLYSKIANVASLLTAKPADASKAVAKSRTPAVERKSVGKKSATKKSVVKRSAAKAKKGKLLSKKAARRRSGK